MHTHVPTLTHLCMYALHNQTIQQFPLEMEVRTIANLKCKHMELERLMDSIVINHLPALDHRPGGGEHVLNM